MNTTYRKLRVGTTIKDGDQFLDEDGNWSPSSGAGYGVPPNGTQYRRPVTVKQAGTFWIQEQAPAGNFFDSIGLDPSTTLAEAKRQTREWAKFKSALARKVRLVVRTDVVIEA